MDPQMTYAMLTAEYSFLHAEIVHNLQAINDFFTVAVTATAVLLGYGLARSYPTTDSPTCERGTWSLFLTPFAVLIPALALIWAKQLSTIRIAAYIRVFLEPVPSSPQWESRLSCFRDWETWLSTDQAFYIAMSIGLIGLAFISLFLAWWFRPKTWTLWKHRLFAIGAVAVFVIFAVLFIIGPAADLKEKIKTEMDVWKSAVEGGQQIAEPASRCQPKPTP